MSKISLFSVYPVTLIGQRQEFVCFCEYFLLYFQLPAIVYTKRSNVMAAFVSKCGFEASKTRVCPQTSRADSLMFVWDS